MKKLTLLAIACLMLAGCATLGGGQTDPILSRIVPRTLDDYGPTLLGNAQNSCNVGAAKEYNANMVTCGNPTGFAAQIPPVPFVKAADIATAITAICATNGYSTPGLPATATVGNCVYATPVPTPAPKAS